MSVTIKPSKTFKIGGVLEVNRLGYGGMQLTGPGVWGDVEDRPNAISLLRQAVAGGINFIDTADAYGPHTNESLIAEALYPYPANLVIATKGGLMRTGPSQWAVNGNPGYIESAIEGSLKRLKVGCIDLWQLHRIDVRLPLEDTLAPVAAAVKAGKIKYVGLSEVGIEQIEQAAKVLPIVSVQNKYNLNDRQWEKVIDYTAQKGIAFIPWYPLASGPGKMADKINTLAHKYQATTAQIALAWLLKRSANILLIPGTKSIEHLQQNMAAANVQLSDEDFASLSAL